MADMTSSRTTEETALTVSGIAGALTAGGILLLALFPLAIPVLLLTAVFVAPLALVGVVAALPIGIAAIAVWAIRSLAGGRGKQRRHHVRSPLGVIATTHEVDPA